MVKDSKKSPITKSTSVRGLEIDYVPHATFTGIAKEIFSSETNTTIDTLYKVVKASPEVSACMFAQVEDIMADEWRFNPKSENGGKGKGQLKKATDFSAKTDYYKIKTDALWDYCITGNAYILKLSVDADAVKSIMEDMTKSLAKQFNVKIKKGEIVKIINQETSIPQDLQVLKANTVKINFDNTGHISSYEQEVQGEKRIYKPEDIIHIKTIGHPYGVSPLEPILSDIGTLIFAKEFAGKYFENDGIPYFIFKMPDEDPDGRNYKLLKKELKELRKKDQKYRSMVLTGNVEFDQVNKFNKDMEFAKLIEHFTMKVFMGLGVPPHRVHYTSTTQKDAAQVVGKIETGYYKKISFIQKGIENILNKDLWSKFGVALQFKRSYKIDEMREAEIIRILSEVGAITIEEAREKIGMDPRIPKGTMAKPIGSDKRIDEAKDKKREQGIDQEPKDRRDNKLKGADKKVKDKEAKEIIGSDIDRIKELKEEDKKIKENEIKNIVSKSFLDAIDVDFPSFVAIVEQKVGLNEFTKANVLYIATDTEFVLFFSDGNWKYKTKVLKTDKFRTEQMYNFIKISL